MLFSFGVLFSDVRLVKLTAGGREGKGTCLQVKGWHKLVSQKSKKQKPSMKVDFKADLLNWPDSDQ